MAWIHLAPEIEQRLDDLVVRAGHSRAYYVHEFIVNGLNDLEDFYLANATMARVRNGQEVILESFEVRSNLGLANDQAN